MATLIVNHKVQDYATWKPKFDSDEPMRTGAGLKLLSVGQKSGEPGNVYIVFDVANPAVLPEMMGSPEFQANMKAAGVISAPETILLD